MPENRVCPVHEHMFYNSVPTICGFCTYFGVGLRVLELLIMYDVFLSEHVDTSLLDCMNDVHNLKTEPPDFNRVRSVV